MAEGRLLVFPQALALGARPLTVPGRGNVLCASAALPFRLSDSTPATPADWYRAVGEHGGPTAVPDAMAPLPGAEVLLIGTVPAVAGEFREAVLRCGQVTQRLRLRGAPETSSPWLPGPEFAIWHEHDNPVGRGGPDDDREPLILDAERPERPVWLGATPFEHPARTRRVGTPDASSGSGWPRNADPAILHEAHEAFWARSLHAGDPLTLTGLGAEDVDTVLPPYRVNVVSARMIVPGKAGELPEEPPEWALETVRIHCVALVPAADLAAVIWRVAIDTGDDVLGERVLALVVALEDVDAPPRDEMDLASIAEDRWNDPNLALDDRPLLPAAMAAAVRSPFAVPEDDVIGQRHQAAEEWMRDETGLGDANPFAKPDAAAEMEGAAQTPDDGPPDINALGDMATAALGKAKRKHEEAGLKPPDADVDDEEADPSREPELRGERLQAEADARLRRPYGSPRERHLADSLAAAPQAVDADADTMLAKITDARLASPQPVLFWPAFNEDEGGRFGDRVFEHLRTADVDHHIDISGAIIGQGPGAAATEGDAEAGSTVSGRVFQGALAEETTWRGVEFENCEFIGSSLAGARFENCEFRGCAFERTNLSQAVFADVLFLDCELRDINGTEVTWTDSRFEACKLARVVLNDPGMRDVIFERGSWQEVQFSDALFIRVTLRDMEMTEVTYSIVHAPYSRFERVTMHKVWAMGRGFPESAFQDIEARTCGFIATCHFDGSTFERVRFFQTGFTNAVLKDARLTPACVFDTCDFSGTAFVDTDLRNARFLDCSMATSVWWNADAREAWFMGCTLRGVDFANTRLTRAVFADADLEGTKLDPDQTIGADFRGTVRNLDQ